MKQSLFVNMIAFVDNAKVSIVKLLELISKFKRLLDSKPTGKLNYISTNQ